MIYWKNSKPFYQPIGNRRKKKRKKKPTSKRWNTFCLILALGLFFGGIVGVATSWYGLVLEREDFTIHYQSVDRPMQSKFKYAEEINRHTGVLPRIKHIMPTYMLISLTKKDRVLTIEDLVALPKFNFKDTEKPSLSPTKSPTAPTKSPTT